MKKYLNFKILIILSILIIFNCKYDRIYHNKFSRYKIKYPENWIAINSKHNIDEENKFIERLQNENSPIKSYQNVDVAFYNPASSPPIFEMITVNSQEKRFKFSRLNELIPLLERQFLIYLSSTFYDVKTIHSEVQEFKKGNIIKFEYYFKYKNNDYITIYIIIPGKLFGTYYINGICKKKDIAKFNESFNQVLNSFHKY